MRELLEFVYSAIPLTLALRVATRPQLLQFLNPAKLARQESLPAGRWAEDRMS